jgi:hypothetical protein
MLLSHAVTLAEARSYLAVLADNARTFDATEVLTDNRDVLYTVAQAAIEELVDHGVDGLQVELLLAGLEDARALDRT